MFFSYVFAYSLPPLPPSPCPPALQNWKTATLELPPPRSHRRVSKTQRSIYKESWDYTRIPRDIQNLGLRVAKVRGPSLGVPIIRIRVRRGSYFCTLPFRGLCKLLGRLGAIEDPSLYVDSMHFDGCIGIKAEMYMYTYM